MGLLDRARRVLGNPASAPVRTQAYRVACPSGHVQHGHRTEGYQALRCPVCESGIFILPRSPLPEPVAPRSKALEARRREPEPLGDELVLTDPTPLAATRSTAGREEAEAEIEWVDEAEEAAPPPSRPAGSEPRQAPARKRGAGPNQPPRKSTPRPAPTPEAVPAGMVAIEERVSLADWARRHKNGLILAAVLLIAVGTVAFRVRMRTMEEFPRLAEVGRTKGLDALDSGDFATAKQILAEAARAVRGLGGDVEGADEILQGAREAALLADFKGGSLSELVEEAAKSNPPDAWPGRFETFYKGRSEVFQAQVTEVPDPNRPGSAYVLDLPIFYGPGPTPEGRGRLDLAEFKLFQQARPRVGDDVTFGARLAAMRFDAERSEWVVTLEPDSGTFITHARALSHLPGWSEEAQSAAAPEFPR